MLKRFLSLGLITITVLLCSCQAPAEETEALTETYIDSYIETHEETPAETQPDTPPKTMSLQELTSSYLPAFEQINEPSWQQKLMDIDPLSAPFQQDKPAVCLLLPKFSDQTVTDLIEKRKKLDGTEMTKQEAKLLLHEALVEKFKKEYIKDPADFVSSYTNQCLIVYASAADLEYYASCSLVGGIMPPEKGMLPDGEAPSRNFGKNLVAWEKNGYTYYYKRGAHMVGDFLYPTETFPSLPVLNEERFDLKGVRPLKLQNVDSMETLAYLKNFDGSDEWLTHISSYDESFFQTKTLFLITFTEGSGSISHTVKTIAVSGNTFYVVLEQHMPEIGTDMLEDWAVLIEADRDKVANCTVFDAWMN